MRRVGAVVAGVLIAISGAAPASAHADLTSMEPAIGTTIVEAPAQVVLTFGEDVRVMGSAVVVIDPTGHEVQSGAIDVSGPSVAIALQPITDAGLYHVNFRILSADGHVVTGSEVFTFTPGTSAAAPAGEATSVPEVSPITEASPTAGFWITGLTMAIAALALVGIRRARQH